MQGDTNFAPLILMNGSVLGLWRRWSQTGSRRGSRLFLATARDWRHPHTYVQHRSRTELFPDLGASGVEDQFLYLDRNGHYHALLHNMVGTGAAERWWLHPTMGHAFSRNGLDWTYGGIAWGKAGARYDTHRGRGANVRFTDGKRMRFTRFERPHAIFAGPGCQAGIPQSCELRGDPTYIVAAAQYGSGDTAGVDARNNDGAYTVVLPVRA